MSGSRAVGYTRVSTKREEMISPELQAHEQDVYAARHGIKIVERVEDLDLSGRDFARRSVDYIVQGIKEGRWDTVLLWKWSRWGRNLLHSRLYLAEVEEAGGRVIAVTEDFDTTTSVGKFTRDQMLRIAELQSDQMSEGWREVHARRRRMGLPHSGYPVFGYIYEKGKGYKLDPVTAPVLKQCYERYVAGEPIGHLARWLNANGYRSVKGGLFTRNDLGRMLDIGFAAGLIRERSDPSQKNRTLSSCDVWRDGAHEPIISRDLWEKYREKRMETAKMHPRRRVAEHTLTGLVVCRKCQGTMYATLGGSNKRVIWRCRREKATGHCPGVGIGNDRLKTIVRDWVIAKAQGGDRVEEDARHVLMAQEAVSNLAACKAHVDRLKVKRKRLLDLYTDPDSPVELEDYKEQKVSIDMELEDAEASLRAAKVRARASETNYREIFTTLADMWDEATPHERRELLSKVIKRIEVWPGEGKGATRRSRYKIIPRWAEGD